MGLGTRHPPLLIRLGQLFTLSSEGESTDECFGGCKTIKAIQG